MSYALKRCSVLIHSAGVAVCACIALVCSLLQTVTHAVSVTCVLEGCCCAVLPPQCTSQPSRIDVVIRCCREG
jgi:hypothetical protein